MKRPDMSANCLKFTPDALIGLGRRRVSVASWGCGAIRLCLLQMKASVRHSPAEKGHLNFDKRCCAPQTHRGPLGDAGRHAKPSPDYTGGLLAFRAAAAPANLHRRQRKPSPSRKQTFIYLRYSEDLRQKGERKKK